MPERSCLSWAQPSDPNSSWLVVIWNIKQKHIAEFWGGFLGSNSKLGHMCDLVFLQLYRGAINCTCLKCTIDKFWETIIYPWNHLHTQANEHIHHCRTFFLNLLLFFGCGLASKVHVWGAWSSAWWCREVGLHTRKLDPWGWGGCTQNLLGPMKIDRYERATWPLSFSVFLSCPETNLTCATTRPSPVPCRSCQHVLNLQSCDLDKPLYKLPSLRYFVITLENGLIHFL